MKILIILSVVAFAISLILVIVKLLLQVGIDTRYYRECLKTNTLFFPVMISDDAKNEMLSKPLSLLEWRLLVRYRVPLAVELLISKLSEPLLIIGTMLLVGGNMSRFDSGLVFCLALLSSFFVPRVVLCLSTIVVWIIEEIYWRSISRKYGKVSE